MALKCYSAGWVAACRKSTTRTEKRRRNRSVLRGAAFVVDLLFGVARLPTGGRNDSIHPQILHHLAVVVERMPQSEGCDP